MDEREKIIKIINSAKKCTHREFCEKCKYNNELNNYPAEIWCSELRIADALINAGIGDVQSLVDGTCVLYVKNKGFMRLYNEQDINKTIHRVKVAERALSRLCEEIMRDIWIAMFPSVGRQARNKQELYDYCIEQAKREIDEEQKQ